MLKNIGSIRALQVGEWSGNQLLSFEKGIIIKYIDFFLADINQLTMNISIRS